MRSQRSSIVSAFATAGSFIALAAPSGAFAQDAAVAVAAGVATGPNPESGLPVGDWMLYPSFFSGAVFNDNVYSQPTNRKSGLGLRLRPALQADRDGGIHKTQLYLSADAQIYPGLGRSYTFNPTPSVLAPPTNATGRAGISHAYEPLPDLKFNFVADYTRSLGGLFGAGGSGASAPTTIVPSGANLTGNGTYSNQFTGSASVEKQFGRAFVRGKIGAQYVAYDSQPVDWWFASLVNPVGALTGANNTNATPQNGLNFTGSVRGGYWVTPLINAFVETTGDFRRYPNSWNNTNGYRIVGGLASDLVSLFRGEIYGGYQAQASASGRFATVSSPSFGARISYYPTRDLTFTATVDQSFTAPVAQSVTFGSLSSFNAPTGPTRTLQAKLQADYEIANYWSAFARAGWGQSKSGGANSWATIPPAWGNGTTATFWAAGVGMSYTFWRNVSATLEYQFTKTINPPNTGLTSWWIPTSVTQNLISAGLTYRY